MNNEIFRKKSIDSINSPEDLNSFLRVTNPPVWIILSAILLLIAGAVVWGCTATLDTKSQCLAVSGDKGTVCYVKEADLSSIRPGTEVFLGDAAVHVSDVADSGILPETVLNDYQMVLGDFRSGETVYALTLEESLPAGNYEAYVVLESISPFAFLFSSSN